MPSAAVVATQHRPNDIISHAGLLACLRIDELCAVAVAGKLRARFISHTRLIYVMGWIGRPGCSLLSPGDGKGNRSIVFCFTFDYQHIQIPLIDQCRVCNVRSRCLSNLKRKQNTNDDRYGATYKINTFRNKIISVTCKKMRAHMMQWSIIRVHYMHATVLTRVSYLNTHTYRCRCPVMLLKICVIIQRQRATSSSHRNIERDADNVYTIACSGGCISMY